MTFLTNHPLRVARSTILKAFDLKCTIPETTETGEPLLLYLDV